jgi:ferrous iron transport protein B
VCFVGNPNAGKSTLFNLLTGARAKVGNYPGVTVDRRSARLVLEGGLDAEAIDTPGTYSLTARSPEESVAADTVLADGEDRPAAIVLVVDATTLRRGLYFGTQVLDAGHPSVVALTMMDEAKKLGIRVDTEALAAALGVPVVGLVANRGEGKEALLRELAAVLRDPPERAPAEIPKAVAGAVERVAAALPGDDSPAKATRALWALLSIGDDELTSVPAGVRSAVAAARDAAAAEGVDLDEAIVTSRYARVDACLKKAVEAPAKPARPASERIDDVLVHPIWGLAVFALVMAVVFQALFSWAEPMIGLLESGIDATKGAIKAALPPGAFTDLLSNGVVAGVGNVIVFVPQIALLFVFITALEDSGYLARVAFVIDRVMGGVGLHGRAFVPMLSGFACAIPAVMATRTIESKKDRLITMLVVPLVSCSARLPVYVLVTATVFAPEEKLGPLSVGAVVLLVMYAMSIVFAVIAAAVLRRTVLKGPKPALVLELPPYRRPSLRNIALATWERTRRFLVDAGTVILALTIVLWGLLTYPKDDAVAAKYEALRAEAAQIEDEAERAERLSVLEASENGENLRGSAGGRIGHAIEPALEPLGFDWRLGVGIVGAFAAREVFVSTLGIVFDIGEADETSEGLRAALREAKRPGGEPLMTPLVGVALMTFFVLACQCMSTIAVVRRESGSWKWALLMLGYMTALAYLVTFFVYQGGKALGFS